MDAIVKAALAKWPNVPHCHGWLGLDSRGRWYMRDERSQREGPFAPDPTDPRPASKGAWLQHDKLLAFIHRNYLADAQGQWFFQNGPQRVYVELEVAPWIWRLLPDGGLLTHTGEPAGVIDACELDEQGRLFVHTGLGLGLVHTADMLLAADQLEAGHWPEPGPVMAADLPARWGFVPSPQRALQAQRAAKSP